LEAAIIPQQNSKSMPVLVFAAAGNWGLNWPRAFPASQEGVFCIYASDGNGYRDKIDPKDEGESSFTTLGVAIPSQWKSKNIYVTGTSYAAPIAASIAATILEFTRQHLNLEDYHWRLLCSYQGMRNIFSLLSVESEHHRYVSLDQLNAKGHRTSEQIKTAIFSALNGIRR
jgi:hypothetical protein